MYEASSFGCRILGCGCHRTRRMSKHDAGFHFQRLSVAQVPPEPPLGQRIRNGFCLIGKCAEKMNVLHLAFFIDNDADWNRVESPFSEQRINSFRNIFTVCVVLYANRNITAAPPRNGAGLLRQAHLVHFLDEILGQFYIPTNKHKLDHVTADLRRQYAPMQLGDGRTVVKADEGVIGDPDKRRWLFHPIVRAQTFVVEIDQVQRVPSRGKREKQILSNNQEDRKSTRLNSSHLGISYAVFCLKKKNSR